VLCRCEDVTAGAIDAAVATGSTTMSALKIVTRCGQGPCQGRTCERLVGERLPKPERFNARAPIRPIGLDVLIDA
jgi:NAD(P)H-nitrite reductase large subunit